MSAEVPIHAGQQIHVAMLTHKVEPSVKTLENPLEKRQCWNALKKNTAYTLKTSEETMRERRREGRNGRMSLQKKTEDVGANKTNTKLNFKKTDGS